MILKITIAVLLSASFFVEASEKVVSVFDGEKESIERMSTIIREAAKEGSTLVRFPTGQWKWHDLSRIELPRKEQLEGTEFDATSIDLDTSVREWITKQKARAVQIAIDKDSPASVFFKIESLLTDMNVPYALVTGAEVGRGQFLLRETDGRVRSIPLDEPKGEQGGADQPTTAPKSKSEGSEKTKPESEGRSQ